MRLPRWPSLPLLSKELIEQSNRRRTFVIRTVYAVLLYSMMLWILWQQVGWNADSLAMLGRGADLFDQLVRLQFFAIYAFLPGLTCGVLTSEKERDTLAMLLLTKLGAWTILIEKLLSRVMPMALLLLLSTPLLAVAYSMGGVEPRMIVAAVWLLAVTMLQVGALAVFCSAWFRTTAGAFVGTYVLGCGVLSLPIFFALFVHLVTGFFGPYPQMPPPGILLSLYGPTVYEMCQNSSFGAMRGASSWSLICLYLLLQSFGLWFSAIVLLLMARAVLWRRAFVQPKQLVLQFFRWLDALFHRLNQNSVTKGVVLINESVTLPLFEPISWRETKKKTLGTTRYLIRFLLVIEPPVLFLLLAADVSSYGSTDRMTPGVVPNVILWVIAVLSITVLSTGLIASEKSKQTLDVLLSTPLTSQEIIHQKMAAVRKLTRVLWVPLLTVVAFDLWWWFHVRFGWAGNEQQGGWLWFLTQRMLPIVVYPPLITWMAFHFGLRMRHQAQAMLATIGVIVAWCAAPLFLHRQLEIFRTTGQAIFGEAGWAIFSPVVYVCDPVRRWLWEYGYHNYDYFPSSYRGSMRPLLSVFDQQLLAYAIHFGMCIALWMALRWWGFRSFASIVQRNDGTHREELPVTADVLASDQSSPFATAG